MNCKQYVFKLTSGQLEQASPGERLHAALHRLSCRHCRAFARNDAELDNILHAWRSALQTPAPHQASTAPGGMADSAAPAPDPDPSKE